MKTLYEQIRDAYGQPDVFLTNLHARMKAMRVTQNILARRAGIGHEMLSRYFRRRKVPSLETMVLLDEAMSRIEREHAARQAPVTDSAE